MRERNRIYFVDIGPKQLQDFILYGPYAPDIKNISISTEGTSKGMEQDVAQAAAAKEKEKEEGEKATDEYNDQFFKKYVANPTNDQLAFFYVSDLVDIILFNIEATLRGAPMVIDGLKKNLNAGGAQTDQQTYDAEQLSGVEKEKMIQKSLYLKFYEQYKKFRLLLGPVEIVNPKNKKDSEFVNFGDLPISVKYFNEWLTEKLLKKDQTVYTLTRFLNDLFNDLINSFLNDDSCFNTNESQKIHMNQSVITSYKNPGQPLDEITQQLLTTALAADVKFPSRLYLPVAPQPVLNISGRTGLPETSRDVTEETNYLVFFAGRTQPLELMNGSRFQDSQRGIFHYIAGRDRGIVKTIKMQRTDIKGHKETRFEQQGYDGLAQLREVYDVNIDCFADVHTFPGTYIFVDPRGFAPNLSFNLKDEGFNLEDLTDYGLGGYYMIMRSEHSFGAGRADTKIIAKWVAAIDKEQSKSSQSAKNDEKLSDDTCAKLYSNRKERALQTPTTAQENAQAWSEAVKKDTLALPPSENFTTHGGMK